jgi:hypothetical protein
MGWFFGLISLINNLFSAWNSFVEARAAKKAAKIDARAKEREAASKDIINAGSEDEFDKASDRLHDSTKRP